MTFPSDPRGVTFEMYLNGTWVDITADVDPETGRGPVLDRDDIVITYGSPDEAGTAAPATCNLTLNDRLKKYSPRKATSPYYPWLGQNTPVRVGIKGLTETVDTFTRTVATGWGTSDEGIVWSVAGVGGTISPSDQSVSGGKGLHSVPAASAYRSSHLAPDVAAVGPDDSYLNPNVAVTVSVPFTDVTGGPLEPANIILRGQSSSDYYLARVTIETNETVTLAIRRETAGTVIAGPVTISGLTHSAGQSLRVRFQALGTTLRARVWNAAAAEPDTWHLSTTSSLINASGFVGVRSGIGAGNTNTKPVVFSYDEFEGPAFRFTGEIAQLPPRFNDTGSDRWVPLTAAGILRRIGQGSQPVASALKAYYLSGQPVTYWALDEGTDATVGHPTAGTYMSSLFKRVYLKGVYTFGDGLLAPHLDMVMRIDDLQPAAGYDFLAGGCVGSQATPNAFAWEFTYRHIPATNGGANNVPTWFFQAGVDGTAVNTRDEWRLIIQNGSGDFQLQLWLDTNFANTGVTLGTSATLDAVTDGLLHHIRIQANQVGANVDFAVYVDGVSVISGTRNTHTLRRSQDVHVHYDRSTGQDLLALGHIIVWETTANIPPVATTAGLAHGFAGETAGRRFERLCGETGTPFASIGDLDDTLMMGLQYEDYFANQLTEIETTDQGRIYEPRSRRRVGYRTRTSLYNQAPAAVLSVTAGQLDDPFEPVDDDQQLRNDVFAQRRNGGSYQATLLTGRLSVLEPEAGGVGRYKDEVQVNVQTDDMLPASAGWLLHLGTVDEPRYPQIAVDLAGNVAADQDLSNDVLSIKVGDRVDITNLAVLGIDDDASVIVLGYTETLNHHTHRIVFNCAPASPYEVNELDDGISRIDPDDGSTLASGVTSTATSLSVASAGFLWTTAGGDMPIPIMVGGEEMTVTAISGASSPQTFTVTRSVNGVVKTHSTGAVVRLKRPGVVAL
jgi:hypothetical protein